MRQEDWQIVCRDVRTSPLDSKDARQLAHFLDFHNEITEKYRKKIDDSLNKTRKATSQTNAITLLRKLILFFEHESTEPASTTTIRKVNGEQRLYMVGNVKVMIAEWFLVRLEPCRKAIAELEKFRENSTEAKTLKFKRSADQQSVGGKKSKKGPDELKLKKAELILGDKCFKTFRSMTKYLKEHLVDDETFSNSWVTNRLKHRKKK